MDENIEIMQNVKSLNDVSIEGKRVLIRVDFNVPLDDNHTIEDDTRIRQSLKTINYCLDHKAKYIILVSHLGRPKQRDENLSLKHIVKRLERLLNKEITFVDDFEKEKEKEKVLQADNANVFLFENIRFWEGEEKNSQILSKQLASFCDVYVFDAFGTSHREHASTFGITEFCKVKVAGFLVQREIKEFSKVLLDPVKPFLLIVGGAKVSSKIVLLQNILPKVERIIIGGAMSNTFLKALGFDTKNALVEDDYIQLSKDILDEAKKQGVKIYLPCDVVSTNDLKTSSLVEMSPVQDISDNQIAVDIGDATIKLFKEVVLLSKTIVWNGPMGVFENDKFSKGTFELARAIGDSCAYSIVGGGDTTEAINKADEKDKMSFISTGGGASLELLEGKVLPALKNLDHEAD